MGANASGSERGAVVDNRKTSNGAEAVLTEGAAKSVVVGAEVPADPLPKASVRLPAKIKPVCSDASVSKEAESQNNSAPTPKIKSVPPLMLPLGR
ncbi:hypothetical protein D9619_008730 [Psilocybe cf. subviscida]|uniref:Uncharacterized protein n=1 Tax=Psilocybe cf. subviscida TaxID=2480587 RepID=A0A8H5F0M2_9AGAR|nr:hypothetical protein D9619_008730 [Psilocybe cf. subviscida]